MTLTYSNNPRKHIWTYAGGYYEQGTGSYHCPYNNGSQYRNHDIPFVGNDYCCESGRTVGEGGSIVYTDDPSRTVKTVQDLRLPVVHLLRCHGL